MTDPTRNLNTDHERAVLRLAKVGKSFGNVSVLKNIDLVVKQGETVAIVGPSGSGKTTLLRCINFLETYDEGSVFVVDELVGYRQIGDRRKLDTDANISRARRRTGMVFQRFALFPHKTVVQNLIEGPVHVLGISSAIATERAMAVLQSVGLAAKANAYPSQLSGGQQQRVGIARALCMDPELLLFDEVTSALDPELVGEVLAVMKDLSLQRRTMVVVTHELRFARDVADRMVFMEHGSIVADLPTTEFFENPPNDRISAFLRASAGK